MTRTQIELEAYHAFFGAIGMGRLEAQAPGPSGEGDCVVH